MRAITHIPHGNSFPIVLEHEDQTYLVKLRAGMSGQYGLLSEWLGNILGRALGLNTQVCAWLDLRGVDASALQVEVRDLVGKSQGINLGFPFLKNAREIKGAALRELDTKPLQEVFLLDLLLLNIDRSQQNSNLLLVDEQITSIDYESGMVFTEILHGVDLLANPRILQCLKSNPLYQPIAQETIASFLEQANALDFTALLNEVPLEILNVETREKLWLGLEKRKTLGWRIEEALQKLESVVLETAAERKERANQNEARFREKMKKTK